MDTTTTTPPRERTGRFLDDLARSYERLHTGKEDAFWNAYMGLAPDAAAARAELDAKEIELSRFLRDPARLAAVRAEVEAAEAALDAPEAQRPGEDDLVALAGWLATFEAHAIADAAAAAKADEIVAREGALARSRGSLALGYERQDGRRVEASSVELGVRVASDPDARVRRSAWEGLRAIETHVLANGFVDLVRERNRLGRMLGGEDYYDWKVRRVEGLSKAEVFALLDDLERRTREGARAAVEALRARQGAEVTPWNLRWLNAGDVTAEQDPHFPFALAVERWGRSFAALGISYRGAELVLDLVDRKGKYENGFMHGPVVAWRDRGRHRPARIQFTANAIPGVVGSGRRAIETLFHEGGHAAHFANVDMPAPCFGQEFAPTSVAFAETQSMLCDSLVSDADWQARYARTRDGAPIPFALQEKGIRATQPFSAWNLRAMCAVSFAERAIYEIPDAELSPERVLRELRDVERRLLFLEQGSPRPVLSVPHLLSGESSAYYHGYVLADVAVAQARAFFRQRDGHLCDNPRVGPTLRDAWWVPGNSKTFFQFVEELCGSPLSAEHLSRTVLRTPDAAVADARQLVRDEPALPHPGGPVELDARIRISHGNETIATNERSFDDLDQAFRRWIDRSPARP